MLSLILISSQLKHLELVESIWNHIQSLSQFEHFNSAEEESDTSHSEQSFSQLIINIKEKNKNTIKKPYFFI